MKPAATTPRIPSFVPDLRSDTFQVDSGRVRLRALLDSAASEHVVGSGIDADLLSPTSMVTRVANGAETRSTGQLNVMTEFGPSKVYQLPGCPASLASLPQLTGKRHQFYLRDNHGTRVRTLTTRTS